MHKLATSVEDGRAPAKLTDAWSALQTRADQPPPGASPLRTLLGQLRVACRTASVPALDRPPDPAVAARPHHSTGSRCADGHPFEPDASFDEFRHALRLSFAVTLATAIYRMASPARLLVPDDDAVRCSSPSTVNVV